jgi:4-hydroxy-2-oxoheptanedioate aldolase
MRINKAIDLFEQGQQAYVTEGPAHDLTYEAGLEWAGTWADVLLLGFEHQPFDPKGLAQFMRGLKDGGPTASGHATPTVLASPAANAVTREEVLANAWQARQVLAAGVHGVWVDHARDPDAVRAFVAACRFPFQAAGRDLGLPEGLRGQGNLAFAQSIWGVDYREYQRRADPWPLNPDGELLLGIKIEDRHGLQDAHAIAATPGIYYCEWGPGDMAMSHGILDYKGYFDRESDSDPKLRELRSAMDTVRDACQVAGITMSFGWRDPSMTAEENARFVIEEIGARMIGTADRELPDAGRKLTGRTMPV